MGCACMIALLANNYIWNQLKLDTTLNAKYDKYRVKYGPDFIPFFPVYDDHAGDISWGSECYVLYDPISTRPSRNVFAEQREQIMYTVVGPIPDLFEFKDKMIGLFSYWLDNPFAMDGYRVNDVNIWQSDGTRGRDKLRQTYSTTLTAEVHYISC